MRPTCGIRSPTAFGPPPRPLVEQSAQAKLLGEFERFATLSDGTVGIAVRDLQTGETQAINGDTLFPMASAYKVAVAGRIFALIDAGDVRLDDQLALDPALASEGGIAWMFSRPGASLSVQRLLELMLQKSDNNATDVLVARAGGPAAITHFVKGLGVDGLRVDSDTAHLLYRAMGIPPSLFTVLFAVARTVGWIAQWKEMIEDPSQKIGRPRQLYTGYAARPYVPLDQRP